MANHKFRVGQVVDFNYSRADVPASGRDYKILALLPRDGGEQLYRIKAIKEPCERIAKESEIALGPKGYGHRCVLQYCERQKSFRRGFLREAGDTSGGAN